MFSEEDYHELMLTVFLNKYKPDNTCIGFWIAVE